TGRAVLARAGVVGIGRVDEVVAYREAHVRAADAGGELPMRIHPPFDERVLVEVAHGVRFVAAQLAGHAVAVHEAAPTLVHPVVVDAERRIDATAHRANALRPLQVQPPEAAVEIDDAAGGSGRGAAECEELAKPALAAVGAQAQRGVLPDAPLPVGAELAMIDAFA